MKLIYLGLFFVAFIVGCDRPQTAFTVAPQVRGRVTLAGEPLAGAKIVFVPQQRMSEMGEVIPFAYAITDADGNFDLKQSTGGTDIQSGDYRVIISKRMNDDQEKLQLSDLVDEFEQLVPDDFALFRNKTVRSEILPARYNENTILTFKVESDSDIAGANFDLMR